MSDLVKIARQRVDDSARTHWEGCERDHRECLIQRMADEIERLRAENETLKVESMEAYEITLDLREEINMLRERDEAVAALRSILDPTTKGLSEIVRIAREALAKIEGAKHE